MKNRKVIVTAFLLVAVMLLGVGYAALTDILDVNGRGEVSEVNADKKFDENVHFQGVRHYEDDKIEETHTDKYGNVAYIDSADDDIVHFSANNLAGKGDSVEFTFVIINEGDLNAILKVSGLENSNPEYFDIVYKVNGVLVNSIEVGTTVLGTVPANNGTLDITVVVTVRETPTSTQTFNCNLEITATADEN
jgi:hypothetical protein